MDEMTRIHTIGILTQLAEENMSIAERFDIPTRHGPNPSPQEDLRAYITAGRVIDLAKDLEYFPGDVLARLQVRYEGLAQRAHTAA